MCTFTPKAREGMKVVVTLIQTSLDRVKVSITLLTRILTLSLLTSVSACGAQEQDELAKNDVWHKAKLRGVAFRAIGQEPGWLLEITQGKEILLVTNYGQERKSLPYVEPQEDKAARKTVFALEDSTSVLIEGKPCSDSMSGESFQTTVSITIGALVLNGCGRALF